jgi:hypothetical protein
MLIPCGGVGGSLSSFRLPTHPAAGPASQPVPLFFALRPRRSQVHTDLRDIRFFFYYSLSHDLSLLNLSKSHAGFSRPLFFRPFFCYAVSPSFALMAAMTFSKPTIHLIDDIPFLQMLRLEPDMRRMSVLLLWCLCVLGESSACSLHLHTAGFDHNGRHMIQICLLLGTQPRSFSPRTS